jgi:oxygen-independent coproporphyrinogen III oxidase
MISLNPTNEISIYIHVPFCQSKCGYCDFYSLPYKTNHSIFDDFTSALQQEIKIRFEECTSNSKVKTIFLGGGTPSLLSCDQIKKIVDTLHEYFNLTDLTEFTIEVNPGTVSSENLKLYREIGINRISIGVQAFEDDLLDKLERIHSSKQACEAFEFARNAGYENINIDLLFGFPGQSLANLEHSLKQAIVLNPEHLSIYNLIYEDGTPFQSKLEAGSLKVLNEETEEKLYNFTVDFLQDSKFKRYEISNYCQPGFNCEHNLGYWNYRPYLGFGPSAHSFDGNFRRWNNRDLKNYILNLKSGKSPVYEAEEINKQVKFEEWIFLQMHQTTGLDLSKFQDQFELPEINWEEKIRSTFGKKWNEFFKFEHHKLMFTTRGIWLSDEVLPKLMNMFAK